MLMREHASGLNATCFRDKNCILRPFESWNVNEVEIEEDRGNPVREKYDKKYGMYQNNSLYYKKYVSK